MALLRPPASSAPISLIRKVAIAVTAVATMLVGLGSGTLSGAQEARSITMTTPVPERGYWLPEDPLMDFSVACLPGEGRRVEGDDFSDHGWGGSDGFGLGVSREAAAGVYEVVVSCVSNGEVTYSQTFEIEIGEITSLRATVGTVPGECATTTEITVAPGTEVFWCFTLVPHPELQDLALFGWWDVAQHAVSDSLNGSLGTVEVDPALPLGSGVSSIQLGIESSTVAEDTVTNTGSWTTRLLELDYSYVDFSDEQIEDEKHTPVRTASARVVVAAEETTTAATEDAAPTAAAPVAAQPTYTG